MNQLIGICGRCRQMKPLVSTHPRRCKRCCSTYLPENSGIHLESNAKAIAAFLGVLAIAAAVVLKLLICGH